jgi:hypothetical protein
MPLITPRLLAEFTSRNYLFDHQAQEDGVSDVEDHPLASELDLSIQGVNLLAAWQRSTTIDSADAGNATRFANHKQHPNTIVECEFNPVFCHVDISDTSIRIDCWVNGDLQLCFLASMSRLVPHNKFICNP